MGIDLNPEAVRSALPRFAFVSRLHRRLLGRQISGDLLTSLFRPSFALLLPYPAQTKLPKVAPGRFGVNPFNKSEFYKSERRYKY